MSGVCSCQRANSMFWAEFQKVKKRLPGAAMSAFTAPIKFTNTAHIASDTY